MMGNLSFEELGNLQNLLNWLLRYKKDLGVDYYEKQVAIEHKFFYKRFNQAINYLHDESKNKKNNKKVTLISSALEFAISNGLWATRAQEGFDYLVLSPPETPTNEIYLPLNCDNFDFSCDFDDFLSSVAEYSIGKLYE